MKNKLLIIFYLKRLKNQEICLGTIQKGARTDTQKYNFEIYFHLYLSLSL